MKAPAERAQRQEVFPVALAASAVSLLSMFWYWRHGELLLYGDAEAHISIARRIFDSLTPGLQQLGTVWLPLPHLLITPFEISDAMWRSGVGAAIPSMLAFVFGAAGIYRLTQIALRCCFNIDGAWARGGALLAAGIYFANPNLIYLQATAMNEPLYLALFIWAVVWLQEFARRVREHDAARPAGRALIICGVLLCAAELTRYDGWAVAGLSTVAVLAVLAIRRRLRGHLRALLAFALIVAAAPASWVIYNRLAYGNALEFANGKYSAKAIEERRSPQTPRHPGDHDPTAATIYLVRSVLNDLGESRVARHVVFWSAVAGALLAMARRRALLLLLLWTPLPFYVYCIAYGSVPVFVPNLWPWSYYNTRYGTALLPAIAVFLAICLVVLMRAPRRPALQPAVLVLLIAAVGASYTSAYFQPHRRGHYQLAGEPERGPVVWREGKVIAFSRGPFEHQLARQIQTLPADSRLLMSVAWYPGALQYARIHLRRVINEGNSKPLETGGLWNDALAHPATSADFVIAMDGDPVAAAVATHPEGLQLISEIHATGQPSARIFRSLLRKTAGD
jgi:hypothetical protein